MASSDLRRFLEDALLRYDPDIDLSEGSRANAELVEPIIERVGIDPFDQDIATFVQTRVRQAFPSLAITEVDELTDVLIDPMRVLIEPLVRETKLVKLRRSLRNVESLSDDEVDALLGNFFFNRIGGGFAVGVVRLYFATPQSITLSAVNPATTRSGLRFLPTRPQQITADQMLLNVEGTEYYFDANYTAERRGDEYNVEPREIVSIANLPTAVRVRNLRRFRFGAPRETNAEFVARAERSLGDKTLNTDRGIVAVLPESFPGIRRIFSVGFRDPEMRRDIVRGAGLGPVPTADVDGEFYGAGTAPDDLDADTVTDVVDAPTGAFVSRLGAVGSVPQGWYVTLVYSDPTLRVVEVPVLEVLSDTQIRVAYDLPVTSPALTLTWMLRRQGITLSDIPGGIVLPDSIAGTLELPTDTIHIGGKTDVYLAGETETATAQIEAVTDESPLARGADAETQASSPGLEDQVILNDYVPGDVVPVPGMSLVLEEGVDAGSYRIISIPSTSPYTLRLASEMTGTQGGLSWRVVDEIDVDLTDPKAIKLTGADLITIADNPVVTTASSSNFIDANVAIGDVVELLDDTYGGEYIVTEVNAVSLRVEPALPRTLGSVAYRIFRRSEGVDAPVVRVSAMEILDSSGAPSGTQIPYRDPVAAISNATQNEGSGLRLDARVVLGLVTRPVTASPPGTYAVGGLDFFWEALDPDRIWEASPSVTVFTFSPGAKTAAQVAAEINSNVPLADAGVLATVITSAGSEYVGIVSARHVRISGGSALTELGWVIGSSNARVRAVNADFSQAAIRLGDVVEVVDGPNAGTQCRVIFGPTPGASSDEITAGTGPIGPEDTNGQTALFNNTVFAPSVDARVRIGRPSVGSARVYFLAPTSAEFRYATTRLTARVGVSDLVYIPDPENQRVLLPPPPSQELTHEGVSASPNTLTDTSVNFLLQGIQPGDLLELLYIPITGTTPLASVGNIAVSGLTLRLRLGSDPFITVTFPFDMPRQDVVDYINEQVGETIASLATGGELELKASESLLLDSTATALGVLFLSSFSNEHPDAGIYIVQSVSDNMLTLSQRTPGLVGVSQSGSAYRVLRHVQRISSTEMNENQDATGLYYYDVQMISRGPGDVYNLNTGVDMLVEGHAADGYRLSAENSVLSYSRAEVLRAELSRTILLVGSSDSPEEYVQISQQNVQVTYDRSQLVDEVQSFCDSDLHRVLNEEILVRHLFPHYISMTWNYLGGSAEAVMRKAVETLLDEVEPDEALEVTDLTSVLTKRGATSVYVSDSDSPSGRGAPLFVVVYHDEERRVRAQIVKDFVTTVRTQRYIPDNIRLIRVSAGTLR